MIAGNLPRVSSVEMTMLEICSLTKRYNGIPAVQDFSFTIRPGEILGYVGPNGAGKSTTVKMIIGLNVVILRKGRVVAGIRSTICGS